MVYFFRCGSKWMVAAICLLTCHCLLAQVNVAGTIVDPDGAAVPNIGVVLKTLHGDEVSGGSANSDAVGRFHLTGILLGDYEFDVPAKYGFEQYQAPIHVHPGMHDLSIRLSPLSSRRMSWWLRRPARFRSIHPRTVTRFPQAPECSKKSLCLIRTMLRRSPLFSTRQESPPVV